MRIEFHLEEYETLEPIEVASALIRNYLENTNDYEMLVLKKNELSAIVEHIQVFLKHSEVKIE